jgi:hypothetical protein
MAPKLKTVFWQMACIWTGSTLAQVLACGVRMPINMWFVCVCLHTLLMSLGRLGNISYLQWRQTFWASMPKTKS